MLRTESFDDRLSNSPDEEGYDFYPIKSGQGYYLKFTPPSDAKLCSRLYPSRLLSRSLPRRNRSLVNFKINRSLQFDSSINPQEPRRKSDSFLSPKSVGHSPINRNLPLSRSAKILKSLNIEYSPVMNNEYKKINKTLKFDLSPSSSRFKSPIPSTASNSRCKLLSNSSIKSSGINKSLNFDSCDDSPVASAHETSIESMDENQNQTPSSQKSRKIKKTLSYLSLSSSGSGTSSSFEFNLLSSPGLRTELREKIDDIVVTSMMSTPQSKLLSGHKQLINDDEIAVSTPRNLYKDFTDDEIDTDKGNDDNDDEERPETPVNVIRLIPESMSAIKKSHRKERFTGRFMNRISQNSAEEPLEMDVDSEERATTPLTSDVQKSPNFSIHSIKKSHKKDISKKKLCVNHSEDELSDDGSLFDYSSIEEEKVKTNSPGSKALPEVNEEVKFQTPPKTRQNETQPSTPATPKAGTSTVMTPENRIDYLKRIMTDSIKKSHKKLKDSNKKTLFKSRLTERQQEIASIRTNGLNLNESPEPEINSSKSPNTDAELRAGTPENINSSRILLSKFSSVKKSHRKDKHRKIGFAQRHIMMNDSIESSSPEMELCKSPSKRLFNIPRIDITAASTSSKSSNDSTSIHHDNNRYQSLNQSVLDSEDGDFKLISSPNKRKSPNVTNSTSIEESNNELKSIDDQCAEEEEFKIFTPIKKRKSIGKFKKNNANECVFSTPKKPVDDLCSDRCETPRLGINILLPGLGNAVEKNKNYNNSNNNIENIKRDDAICEGAQSDGDTSGRQTPDNLNRIKMISSLSSIKKSHRKDKWAKVRTRESSRLLVKKNNNSLNVKDDFEDLSMVNNTSWRSTNLTYDSSSDGMEKNESSEEPTSPKPSTSSINNHTAAGSNAEPVATPPNCLQVKKYLMLVQNTSIKKSRKKMREKKKHDSIIVADNDQDDGNLSDGSIFDGEQKKSDYESSGLMEDDDVKPLDGDNYDRSNKVLSKSTYSKSLNSNRSNDGSIFGSDDETNSPSK
ncbi:GSCOCG00006143001-RA-CDS [Cotesia congregata]|nr:GSCOCG00006143001-RA-CDS [Cotesia congregata]